MRCFSFLFFFHRYIGRLVGSTQGGVKSSSRNLRGNTGQTAFFLNIPQSLPSLRKNRGENRFAMERTKSRAFTNVQRRRRTRIYAKAYFALSSCNGNTNVSAKLFLSSVTGELFPSRLVPSRSQLGVRATISLPCRVIRLSRPRRGRSCLDYIIANL